MGKTLFKNPTVVLFILLFILFASVILGDNVSDSLFLANYDPSTLPWMFIINAAFLFLISLNFISLIDRLDRGRLMQGVLLIHFSCLLLIRAMVMVKFKYAFPFLYSYAYSAKMIVFLTFWTMANDIISAREAKASFPKIAGGGVLGGILISFSVVFIIKRIPAEDLLLIWAGLVLLSMPLVHHVHKQYLPYLKATTQVPSRQSRLKQRIADFDLIKNESLLRTMATIYFLTFILLFAHDYIFLSTLKETFIKSKDFFLSNIKPEMVQSVMLGEETTKLILKKEIPVFLGFFKGIANSITTLLQLTVAGLILKRMGTVRSTLVMPMLFFITYLLILLCLTNVFPSVGPMGYPFFGSMLFFIILISIALRIAVFDSIYSPNFQIFFSAINKDIRGRGKIFIEGIVKPFAILAAGILIIMLFNRSYILSVSILLLISIVLLYLCIQIRKSYSETISKTLGGGKTDRINKLLSATMMDTAEPALIEILADIIHDPDPEVSDFAVTYLAKIGNEKSFAILYREFDEISDIGKARMVKLIGQLNDIRFHSFFETGLKCKSPVVKAESILALKHIELDGKSELLSPYLGHENVIVRSRAIVALWESSHDEVRNGFVLQLEQMVGLNSRDAIASVLFAAGEIGDDKLMPVLSRAIYHPAIGISRGDYNELTNVIISLSGFREEKAIRLLLNFISVADHLQRTLIEKALTTNLVSHDELLSEALTDKNHNVRHLSINVMTKAKENISPATRNRLTLLLDSEIKRMYRLSQYCMIIGNSCNGDESEVLIGIIRDSLIKRNLGYVVNIFNALSDTDILSAIPDKIISPSRHIRSNAIELLENNVSMKQIKYFLPLCEDAAPAKLQTFGRSVWNFDSPDIYFVLSELYKESDPWIRAFTLYTAFQLNSSMNDDRFLRSLNVEGASVTDVLKGLVYG